MAHRRDDALTGVRWDRLEHLLASYYRDAGYAVDHVGTGGTSAAFDGGVDLELRRGDEVVLVQVKHWNAYKVPHNEVNQLIGLMINARATGAILVTSGEFTKAAIEAATRHGHVRLIDGDELRAMLGALPEPPASSDLPADAPALSRGERIATRVGEHLVHTAMDRLVPGPRGGRGGGIKLTLGLMAAKALFSLAVLAGGFFMFKQLIEGLNFGVPRSAATAPASGAPSQARGAPAAMQSAPASMSVATHAMPIAAEGADCREVIDHFSGTFIDHCAQARASRTPSSADQQEARRRADAAMEVLRASTPEF
ncbi:restriction endonuclease [Luteimonas abyssi]|uniref:restriction endonuclease n=1 Tax=Luteimonas abyssi TaxID=1247514 RepID=UPI001EE43E90|nr:restriction endonuclease [Luteimonas abyssi]